jgi:hypothetical protein
MYPIKIPSKQLSCVGAGLMERLSYWWCRYMHTAVMWPMNGYYHCRVCHRRYPVPWEHGSKLQSQVQPDETYPRWEGDLSLPVEKTAA